MRKVRLSSNFNRSEHISLRNRRRIWQNIHCIFSKRRYDTGRDRFWRGICNRKNGRNRRNNYIWRCQY